MHKIQNDFIYLQTEDQEALWQQILDIVNKTNLIDYTMDIRKRLQLGDEMPQVSEWQESGLSLLQFAKYLQLNAILFVCRN